MSNALTETAPNALANPLRQAGNLLAQPAVRRAMPFLFLVGLVVAGWIAWSMIATGPQRILFTSLTDSDKAAVTSALDGAGIQSSVDSAGSVTVNEDDFHKARMLLATQDLPKAQPGGYQILDSMPMGVSRAVEGERLRQARETELAKSIKEIDAVAEARVHLATPEASAFVRDRAQPSASVILKLQPGRALGDAQIRAIVNLVASSVPGLTPESVTIVDQAGALLSKQGAGGASGGDTRIDFQRRVEDKYRQQLTQLLTPLLGAGNFSAEVQVDVDLNESQATRESYDKENSVVRAEQGNWQGTGPGQNGSQAPGGIPGALSNTPPPASTMTAPNAQPTPAAAATPGAAATTPGTVVAAAATAATAAPIQKQSDQFARTYDQGREVSVTRAVPGGVKRASVAILLREEPGKPRGKVEIDQITQLVRATIGFDPNRGDNVTVISRKFNVAADAGADAPAWYDAGWVPLVTRNVTALIIALLVLFLGVRPLAKALMKRSSDASPNRPALAMGGYTQQQQQGAPGAAGGPPVSVDMLQSGQAKSYDERVGLVRGFTRDNPARAALAVRDMIKADAQ